MTKPFEREEWLASVRADIAEQRQTLARLVDELHEAYRQAGGTAEGYVQSQFYQNLLFQAVKQIPDGTAEKRAAFKVCLIFMRAMIQHYKDMKRDFSGVKENDIRQP